MAAIWVLNAGLPVVLGQQRCDAHVLVLEGPPIDLGGVRSQHNLHMLQSRGTSSSLSLPQRNQSG